MLTKLTAIVAVLGLGLQAMAQTTKPVNDGLAAPTLTPTAPIRNNNEPPRKPGVPTLWLVGDSTMKVGTKGQQGWGTPFATMFDPDKVRVINRAIGGRSSRTFVTEGRWDAILQDAEKGDYVIIQLGHNDGGPLNEKVLNSATRARGTIKGVGEETEEVDNILTKKHEVVHTFGWYIRKMVTEAQAKGLTPIVCSWVPHGPRTDKPFTYDPNPKPDGYRLYAQQVAEQTGAKYIDLYGLVWKTYEGKTPEEIKAAYFTAEEPNNTHSSPAGAKHNAEAVVEGLKQFKDVPLAGFLKPQAEGATAK
ncbi:MAG: rhamnogalacturonan acetylesterase [Tepidisphaeraceae bacterium]